MTRYLMAALVVAGLGATARAGGPPPVYVVVDRVVLEPSADAPERIRIEGSFVRLEAGERDKYGKPGEGSIYLSSAPGKEKECRAEWVKWQKAAGTGKVVMVGSCGEAGTFLTVRIRKRDEQALRPDAVYSPECLGRVGDLYADRDWEREPPVRDLLAFVKTRAKARPKDQ
jgi:hypothetical protein